MAPVNGNDDEPFGTTAIPNGAVKLRFDESKMSESIFDASVAQQPQTQAFATYEATKNEALDPLIQLNGSLIDVNPHFVVYALRNGLIRVLHRNSAMRALLRGHANQVVTDITFFHDGDTVATVGNDSKGTGSGSNKSTLIVWRVYESPPEIGSERLLEITNLNFGGAPDLTMSRLVWHPFNPNQFWMTHSTATSGQVATLVETTRIQTKLVQHKDPKDKSGRQPQQHAVCQWHSPYCVMENALQLREPTTSSSSSLSESSSDGQLVDLCWSGRDARHVLSVHKNGSIILWDLKAKDVQQSSESHSDSAEHAGTILPQKTFVLKDQGVEHSRCVFLPHEQSVALHANKDLESLTTCFVTASDRNSKVTLWSAFAQKRNSTSSASAPELVNPTKLQEIDIGHCHPSSFVLDICYGPAHLNGRQQPPSSFLMMGSRDTGRLYALHVKSEWSEGDKKAPLCAGVDYMVPFSLKHPVYSWSVICGPTQDVTDEGEAGGSGFDIKAFAYQSKAVQCLTVTSNMNLPPRNAHLNDIAAGTGGGIYAVEALTGPYTSNGVAAAAASGIGDLDYEEEEEFEEEEYNVEDLDIDVGGDDDDDADAELIRDAMAAAGAPSAPAAVAAPTTGGGSIFPGAPNPFANWLGALAGSTSANAAPDDTDDDDDDALPTPPAPSDLPMPPGILAPTPQATKTKSLPPPPPGMVGPPPGMVPPPVTIAASNINNSSQEIETTFLNPLELLANSMSGKIPTASTSNSASAAAIATKPNDAAAKAKNSSSNSTPRRNNNNNSNISPKRPQSSKKGNKNNSSSRNNNSSNNNKSPFPDGKVTILKRNTAPLPLPLPSDPSVLSDPSLLAAAGIPVPPTAAAIVGSMLPQQSQQQPPIAPAAAIDLSVLEGHVQKAVEAAMSGLVVPAVHKSVQESFATLARPLQNSMNSLSKKGVSVDPEVLKGALDVETPLKAAFADNLRNVLVPSLQSITGQVLQQVKSSMPKPSPPPKDDSKLLAALVQQLQAMNSKMDALSSEVQGLRQTVADQAAAAAAQAEAFAEAAEQRRSDASAAGGNSNSAQSHDSGSKSQAQIESELIRIRNEVNLLLSKGKYDEAFTKAVATTTPQMAVYCCARSDVRVVLSENTTPPVLSQPILICLMQQLSAALSGTQSAQEMQIELTWLQEITLTMNPTDPSIVQHVPKVLRQLVSNVNARLQLEGTGPFRRPLQMLLNSLMGMQMAMGK